MRPLWRRTILAGIWILIAGVALIGILHHRQTIMQTAGSPHLFSSPGSGGNTAASGPPRPNDTNLFQWHAPAPGRIGPPPTRGVADKKPQSTPNATVTAGKAPAGSANTASVSALAGGFPMVVHQVLVSVPESGSEPVYFARLGNLLNGTPMPGGTLTIPPTADHLAHAQADLDRGNISGAITEVQAISGPAAVILRPWLKTAEVEIEPQRRAALQTAQSTRAVRPPPLVMPTEIQPYARESTDPAAP